MINSITCKPYHTKENKGKRFVVQHIQKKKEERKKEGKRIHLGVTTLTDASLEDIMVLLENKSISTELLIEVKVGCLGRGRVAFSLSSINTTEGILGLLFADSSTHNMPTCMHLNTSSRQHESAIDGSTSSIALPSFHSFHA